MDVQTAWKPLYGGFQRGGWHYSITSCHTFGATLWRAAQFRSANELAAIIRSVGLTVHAIRGAIFFPPWAPMARLMAPFDLTLGRTMTFGAAFVAVKATKP